jgi:hypothetical protein
MGFASGPIITFQRFAIEMVPVAARFWKEILFLSVANVLGSTIGLAKSLLQGQPAELPKLAHFTRRLGEKSRASILSEVDDNGERRERWLDCPGSIYAVPDSLYRTEFARLRGFGLVGSLVRPKLVVLNRTLRIMVEPPKTVGRIIIPDQYLHLFRLVFAGGIYTAWKAHNGHFYLPFRRVSLDRARTGKYVPPEVADGGRLLFLISS